MSLNLGIDLDGVVYDFADSFRRHLGDPSLPEPQQWETWEAWGMDKQDWLAEFVAGVASGVIFGTGEPHEGAAEAIRRLYAKHRIHIVTNRNIHPNAVNSTARWLVNNQIPYHSLTFSADKTVVPCDIFIEDNVENAEVLSAAGTLAVLMDRPWNRHSSIRRVSSWEEFELLVGEHELQRVSTGNS